MDKEEIEKKGKKLRLSSILGSIGFCVIGVIAFVIMFLDKSSNKTPYLYIIPAVVWLFSLIMFISSFRPYETLIKEDDEMKRKQYEKKHKVEIAEENIKSTLSQHNFVTTNEVGFSESKIFIDTNSKQWSIQDGTKDGLSIREVRKLADILSFEIVDNSTIVYKTKVEGGLTRAIIGGALFGGVGAIVGANTAGSSTSTHTNNSYKVLFTVNDINSPTVEFNCFGDLGVAQKVVATFEVIKYNY
ncbi:MAG: hypothetical protein RR086_02365 [Clostridia bacterium]